MYTVYTYTRTCPLPFFLPFSSTRLGRCYTCSPQVQSSNKVSAWDLPPRLPWELVFTIISLQPSLVTRSPTNTRHHTTRISYDISYTSLFFLLSSNELRPNLSVLMMKIIKIIQKRESNVSSQKFNLHIHRLSRFHLTHTGLVRKELNRALGEEELARDPPAIIGHQGQLQRVLPSVFIEIVPRINVPRCDDKRGKRKEEKKTRNNERKR